VTQRVEVFWRDIVSDAEWHNAEVVEAVKPAMCRSMGYLRRLDKDNVLLSHTLSGGDGDYTTIPRGCVVDIFGLQRAGRIDASKGIR